MLYSLTVSNFSEMRKCDVTIAIYQNVRLECYLSPANITIFAPFWMVSRHVTWYSFMPSLQGFFFRNSLPYRFVCYDLFWYSVISHYSNDLFPINSPILYKYDDNFNSSKTSLVYDLTVCNLHFSSFLFSSAF